MLAEPITVRLPTALIDKVKKVAELTYRTMDEVIASTIDAALVAPQGLPPEIASELAAMSLLSDAALWNAVQPTFSTVQQKRLQQLNRVGGERTLTKAELTEQSTLLEAYQRSILQRAQAIAILKQRGHVINETSLQ